MKNDLSNIKFSDFLASMVHDLKNSLGMMLNTLDEIFDTCSPNQCPSYKKLSRLQYEAKRINNDLIQLLTLYKMDNQRYTLNITYQSVYDFIEDIVLQNKSLLEFKGINTIIECDEDFSWFFDPDLVSGVMNNIINNAIRYTKDSLWIKAFEENGYLVINIEDNGNGYPDYMLNTNQPSNKGVNFSSGSTGLGLYFASIVARLHRNKGREGYISTRNKRENRGGCFSLYLP